MNIILTGMMGVGKTTIGKRLAQKLNLTFLDLDGYIEKKYSMTIPKIFSHYGEKYFRKLEREVCKDVIKRKNIVIATGGKTLLDKKNLRVCSESGIIITLLCSPEKILKRIQYKDGQRPLLATPNPEQSLHKIYNQRKPHYLNLPNKIDTTNISIEEVLLMVISLIEGKEIEMEMVIGDKTSSIRIKKKIIENIGSYLKNTCKDGDRVFIITDKKVFQLYGEKLTSGIKKDGFETSTFIISQGERYKSLRIANRIYQWLLNNKANRSSLLISFGGGVISDLSGYAAATFHRGMKFIIIPTTLLAQIDASIGGKNAVNLKEAKNQIGTFYFPQLILIDPLFLVSLGPQQIREGLIEALKAGIIGDSELFYLIKNNHTDLLLKDIKLLEELIIRSIRVKLDIVNKDPFEKNIRKFLNLGHTFGHALESFFNYRSMTHGEAVGLGIICASKLGALCKISSENILSQVKNTIKKIKTPTYVKNLDIAKIISLMEYDKKRKGRKISFIVPKRIGEVLITENVKRKAILESLKEICNE